MLISVDDPSSPPTAGRTLKEIAREINKYHDQAIGQTDSANEGALKCGRVLIEAKSQLPPLKFFPWLRGNCPQLAESQTEEYLRLARIDPAIAAKHEVHSETGVSVEEAPLSPMSESVDATAKTNLHVTYDSNRQPPDEPGVDQGSACVPPSSSAVAASPNEKPTRSEPHEARQQKAREERGQALPESMTTKDRWVCWKYIEGRKVPINATTGRAAKSNDPSSWATYAKATARLNDDQSLEGLGFMLGDGYAGVDLDACIDETGEIQPWAGDVISTFPTYCEASPSKTGVKIFLKGEVSKGRRKNLGAKTGDKAPGIEVYGDGRYFTVTGNTWKGCNPDVVDCQESLDALVQQYWPEPTARTLDRSPAKASSSTGGGIDIAERARRYLQKMPDAIEGQGGDFDTYKVACVLVLDFDMMVDEAWPILQEWNQSHCDPPWDDQRLRRKLEEADKKGGERGRLLNNAGNGERSATLFIDGLSLLDLPPNAEDDWPDPIAPEGFHGVAGDFVAATLPETEADEAALLFHFLTFAAAMMGRERHFPVSGTSHHARLFSVAVGGTATGRKGTALDCVSHVFRIVDSIAAVHEPDRDSAPSTPDDGFCNNKIVNGLVSGAGLIWAIRDARDDDRKKDSGVEDKRLLVVESELGGVLRVCQRKENDLSAVIRDSWDGKQLRSLAKQEPATASSPHINLIGHITREELRATLSKVDTANGFANRILWYCAKRSKLLPRGGSLHSRDLSDIVGRIRAAIGFARLPGRMTRTDAAEAAWEVAYRTLTAPRPGVFGNVTTRAEAQTLRLSMLYALLDESNVIDVQHLQAALAVWRYSEASARWTFGASLGNSTADELLAALRAVKPKGLTSTEVSALFQRNRNATQIREAFAILQRYSLARCESVSTGKGGRPPLVYFAT